MSDDTKRISNETIKFIDRSIQGVDTVIDLSDGANKELNQN